MCLVCFEKYFLRICKESHFVEKIVEFYWNSSSVVRRRWCAYLRTHKERCYVLMRAHFIIETNAIYKLGRRTILYKYYYESNASRQSSYFRNRNMKQKIWKDEIFEKKNQSTMNEHFLFMKQIRFFNDCFCYWYYFGISEQLLFYVDRIKK